MQKYILRNPPSFNYKVEYFYYLIHYITVRQIQNKDEKLFSMNTKYLKSITIWNINQYIIYLVNGEFLLRDNYKPGRKSYHYKINPDFIDGFREYEIQPGTALYSKLVRKQEISRSHKNRLEPHLKAMYKLFMNTDLDYEKAKKWIEGQPNTSKQYYYLTALQMMQDKRFRYFKRNKTNYRLDTNITNLKSELRRYIIGDYASIDLANSQPFFLSVLLNHIMDLTLHINTKDIPLCSGLLDLDVVKWFGKQQFNALSKIHQNDPFFENGELLKFQDSVVNGSLYDDLKSSLANVLLSREDVKEIIFAILFSRNEYHEDYKRILPYAREKRLFAKVYPSIYRMVHILKMKDHAKLSILLQRIESKVFIDIICPELINQGIMPLTIHDSIIIPVHQVREAMRICEMTFEKYFGVIPKFHLKSLLNENVDDGGGGSAKPVSE